MANNELFGIAAHLHVLLRRKTGRVTDTEWMAVNPDYAREVVRFARQRALADGHAELLPWADKLDAAMVHMGGGPRQPLLQVVAEVIPASGLTPSGPAAAQEEPVREAKYVGRLR